MKTSRCVVVAGVLGCALLAPSGRAQTPAPRTFANAPPGFDVQREGAARGRLERVEYESTVTGTRRPAMVYTPPGYSTSQRYPVLYLLHGLGANETVWASDLAMPSLFGSVMEKAAAGAVNAATARPIAAMAL